MRSDWMQGLLDAERMTQVCGIDYAVSCIDANFDWWDDQYWQGFDQYLSNYKLRNKGERFE